jgi:hypothetical protein
MKTATYYTEKLDKIANEIRELVAAGELSSEEGFELENALDEVSDDIEKQASDEDDFEDDRHFTNHYHEDDAILTPSGHLGGKVSLSIEGKHIGEYHDEDQAEKALVQWITKHKYTPSVWWIDDHGGATPYSISKENSKKIERILSASKEEYHVVVPWNTKTGLVRIVWTFDSLDEAKKWSHKRMDEGYWIVDKDFKVVMDEFEYDSDYEGEYDKFDDISVGDKVKYSIEQKKSIEHQLSDKRASQNNNMVNATDFKVGDVVKSVSQDLAANNVGVVTHILTKSNKVNVQWTWGNKSEAPETLLTVPKDWYPPVVKKDTTYSSWETDKSEQMFGKLPSNRRASIADRIFQKVIKQG